MTNTPAADVIQNYENQGYESIQTDSGTGSTILVNRTAGRVAKINYDSAYDVFALHAKSNPNANFVRVHSHHRHIAHQGIVIREFSVTEMELLEPLSEEQQERVISWIESAFKALRESKPLSSVPDDLGLNEPLQQLLDLARVSRVQLDTSKPTNYMIRRDSNGEVFVFTDPFN